MSYLQVIKQLPKWLSAHDEDDEKQSGAKDNKGNKKSTRSGKKRGSSKRLSN